MDRNRASQKLCKTWGRFLHAFYKLYLIFKPIQSGTNGHWLNMAFSINSMVIISRFPKGLVKSSLKFLMKKKIRTCIYNIRGYGSTGCEEKNGPIAIFALHFRLHFLIYIAISMENRTKISCWVYHRSAQWSNLKYEGFIFDLKLNDCISSFSMIFPIFQREIYPNSICL